MTSWLKPTSDIFIKFLLGSGGHENILLSFVNSVLVHQGFKPVLEIEIKNPFNLKTFVFDKESILDIKAKEISGRWFDMEVQISDEQIYLERSLYY